MRAAAVQLNSNEDKERKLASADELTRAAQISAGCFDARVNGQAGQRLQQSMSVDAARECLAALHASSDGAHHGGFVIGRGGPIQPGV